MDSLDHMLTDPLELGPSGEGNCTQIMEDCMLGSIRISLPEDLLEDVSRTGVTFFLPYSVKQQCDLRRNHCYLLEE